ncbi:MAG TPA: alpha/beta fold hydrolase [Sandaracinaceae bacterium LLY-WYZ-13_1]|nr:alpha/beta fold hydrolase [Sandaracinaceae bacterium LLY-WYZ-13_1]
MGDGHPTRGRWLARISWITLALALGAIVAGYVRDAGAWSIVKAPNHDRTEAPGFAMPADVDRVVHAEVGPPAALLEAWILEPRREPRGTALVLHGIRGDKRAMMDVGRALRDRGVRAILVDLRGHGRSSGRFLTYGVVESRDLRQLLDQLEGLGVVHGPVGVYGAAYGGAVGLQLASIDPRVRAVASLSTFASLRAVAPSYAELHLPGLAALLPSLFFDAVVDESGELGGFSPDAADATDAIARTRADVLLVHGDRDRRVPFEQARALMDACRPGRCELMTLAGEDHSGALASREARREAVAFLARRLAAAAPPGGAERAIP